MSLINDALNRARHNHTPRPQGSLPPLPPVEQPKEVSKWLAPAVAIFLVFAVIFGIGWAVAHHSVHAIVTAPPDPEVATQDAADAALPIVPAPPPPVVLNPPDAPQLQGIFYSPKSPTAIVDGKTVGVGDRYQQYHVTEITKFSVTLTDADGKAIKLGMGN